MAKKEGKIFNLTKKHPQTLLLGNGPFRNDGLSWAQFIKKISRDEEISKKYEDLKVPNTILTFAVSDFDDDKRHKKYSEVLAKITYRENELVNQLIKIPFDAVLTTNYTYEIEEAIMPGYNNYSENKKRKYSFYSSDKYDHKYLIHSYNNLDNKLDIWHIHGEARRKDSLVLSHDEYARLTNKLLEHNKKLGGHFLENYENAQFNSWMDYYIMSDLYILGCGLDYAEFDLWWLLNRRKRELAGVGNVIFYEPDYEGVNAKKLIFEDIGVKYVSLGYVIKESDSKKEKNEKYNSFYQAAVKDIENRIIKNS